MSFENSLDDVESQNYSFDDSASTVASSVVTENILRASNSSNKSRELNKGMEKPIRVNKSIKRRVYGIKGKARLLPVIFALNNVNGFPNETTTEQRPSDKKIIMKCKFRVQEIKLKDTETEDIRYNFLIGGDGSVFEGRGMFYKVLKCKL
ncbi:CLUMA_CG000204, isoform B [Clunio marinus]|uniref:CLUMA_CG000204, isoform B n=1 Tax=Clunio marinus TaxID=568069 RepID=A0A1J1HG39_9DIPT|nr:CLUMA_CG000204, isoform B [Clunio marinus]